MPELRDLHGEESSGFDLRHADARTALQRSNRPIVVTPWGVKLCRPSETVLDILPLPQKGSFVKEDGERVLDERGQRFR